jgi:hypothetical protein
MLIDHLHYLAEFLGPEELTGAEEVRMLEEARVSAERHDMATTSMPHTHIIPMHAVVEC